MISNRLKSLVKYVNNNDKIIDIGCDHALLDIYLVENKIVDNIIANDISANALNQGKTNIIEKKLEKQIETRLGNGLEVLKETDNIDTILISGMGTNTILKILNNSYIKNINKLIIQSNRDYDLLRINIINMGFYIYKEEAIEDNDKIYINIIFLRGKKKYTKEELKYGTKDMINKDLYTSYLINKLEKKYINTKDENIKSEIEYLKHSN